MASRCILDPVIAPASTDPTARWLLAHAGSDVDAMTGKQFESFLAMMFARLGYHVELTETYDFGADLIVTRDGSRSAVQAKRQDTPVGDHAVQQAVTGRLYYQCHTTSVVTNADVQPRARTGAARTGVMIVDRVELTRMLQMTAMVESPRLLPSPQCTRCGVPLIERRSRHGPFWGCTILGAAVGQPDIATVSSLPGPWRNQRSRSCSPLHRLRLPSGRGCSDGRRRTQRATRRGQLARGARPIPARPLAGGVI